MFKTIIAIIIIAAVGVGYWIYQLTSAPQGITEAEAKNCEVDADCIVFGEDGDCNCGCFNKNYRWKKEDDCFCAAPKSCKCVGGKCEGVFEEKCRGMTLTEAIEIAINSGCGDRLRDIYICNEGTGTWWIDLDIEKEMCNPACAINVATKQAEINWRCMGAAD